MKDAHRIAPGEMVDLAALPTMPALAVLGNKKLRTALRKRVRRFSSLQERLYAENSRTLLLVFQGMDAAGKDSTIKHVTSGVNPQGVRVANFSRPTSKELEHSWLQRHWPALPGRGHIGIFNRSHYEEAVTLRVHPELLRARKLPPQPVNDAFWRQRLRDMTAFEQHLGRNGARIVKFFLNVSKQEQRRRLVRRLNDPAKNWKFDPSDLAARSRWDDYHRAYEAAFAQTSTPEAPWYVVPADHKPAMRLIVATVVVETLEAMNPEFPKPDERLLQEIEKAKVRLVANASQDD